MRAVRLTLAAAVVVCFTHGALLAQMPAADGSVAELTLSQREEFLRQAKITRTRGAGKGVTGTVRATLSDGGLTHDASIQTIDESLQRFEGNRGVELNFRDSWRYNIAAYRLDRLLGLGMIPPSVQRSYNGKSASFTWWVDDVLMDEGERLKRKLDAPDSRRWNEQMWHVRLFDQLIYNTDRNLGNLVIDNSWTIWMIDHTRSFRLFDKLRTPGNITLVDRLVLDRLKALDRVTLDQELKDYLTPPEIKGILDRRDAIVTLVENGKRVFEWKRPARPAP